MDVLSQRSAPVGRGAAVRHHPHCALCWAEGAFRAIVELQRDPQAGQQRGQGVGGHEHRTRPGETDTSLLI